MGSKTPANNQQNRWRFNLLFQSFTPLPRPRPSARSLGEIYAYAADSIFAGIFPSIVFMDEVSD